MPSGSLPGLSTDCKLSYAVQAQLPWHGAAHSGLGSLMLIVNYSDALQTYSGLSITQLTLPLPT